jgi:hypothetical protein
MSSVTVAASAASYRERPPRLRVNAFGLLQTVAQSIAVISPTMTAVSCSAGVRGSRTGVSYFKIPLSLGAMISWIMLPMGEHGFFPKQLAEAPRHIPIKQGVSERDEHCARRLG